MTDRELTDNTQLLFDYMQRVRELKTRITKLEIEQKALLKFLSKDLWNEIDDEIYDINRAKHLLDIIQNVLDAFKDKLEDNQA